jgi:osmoprotectant transport system permease protein
MTRRILITLLLVAAFALGALAQANGTLNAARGFLPDIAYLSRQQLVLAAESGAIATMIGVPLGVLLTRPRLRRWSPLIMQLGGLGTTIPTLAVLALAMTILGIGTPPALFGLAFLTVLPILLNSVAGLRSVPPHLIEAARGMGMTGWQTLMGVELPNAAFVILAGIRTAMAINVGTVPLAFLIGGGGLGELIFTGIDMMDPMMLLAGAIPTALLAVLVDALIAAAQHWLVPCGVNPLR